MRLPIALSYYSLACTLLITLPAAWAENEEAYRLKPHDLIKLSVYREAELDTEARITHTGEATFPLINSVELEGCTLQEAADKLTRLYDARFLVNPKVSVVLLEAALETVNVVGAVASPTEVSLSRRTQFSLLDALASAGGLTPAADRSRIELIRGEKRIVYSMARLEAPGARPVLLKAGDRINVVRSRFAGQTVMVVGEVSKPGPVTFPLHGKLDLAFLIESAGGVSEKGDPRRIVVKRGGRRYLADLEQSGRHPIAPGDVVMVPVSEFVGKTVTVLGKVSRPGAVPFPYNGELTALEAIARSGGFVNVANRKKVYLTRDGRRQTLNLKDVAEGKEPRVSLKPGDTLFVEVRVF